MSSQGPHGTTHYAYDPEGNLLRKTEPHGRAWHYAWNGAGMLASVTRPDGTEVAFKYDALGRRTQKTYRGQTTHWVWDGNVPLHEWVEGTLERIAMVQHAPAWASDAEIKKRDAELQQYLAQGPPESLGEYPELARGSKEEPITWLFEPETFAPMAKLVGGAAFSIVTDHLGTPVSMLDGDGAGVWSGEISTYGELRRLHGRRREQPSARHACPFRFPGQYEDAETGLYYNRFRYFDPEVGGYVSQDPIGLRGGSRLYAYTADPLAQTDPHGLSATCARKNTWNDFQKGSQGQYSSRTAAADAYRRLIRDESPWPDGFTPKQRLLQPGETFNMALSPAQAATSPGAFGTFDQITDIEYVRKRLAVKLAWKRDVDRVATYRVTQSLPVKFGPVGPQVDQVMGTVLDGGGSQLQMLVPQTNRMAYLEVVSETPL